MHKVLWEFEMQTDHLNSGKRTRSSDSQQQQQQKREPILPNSGLSCSGWLQSKTDGRQKERWIQSYFKQFSFV